MRRTATVAGDMLSCLLLLGGVSVLLAQESQKSWGSGQPAEVTMTGMIVDTHCYICNNKKGDEHRMCGQACAKAGVPLAFLSDKGKIYYAVSSTPGQNPKLEEYADQKVTVSGKVFRRGGAEGIEISSVQSAK